MELPKPSAIGEFSRWPRKPNRKERTLQRRALGFQPGPKPERQITHGTLPDPKEGWVIADRVSLDERFRIAGVTLIRYSDGNTLKFYKLVLRPEELRKQRELAKKKLRKIRRENRDAERKQAARHKREVRCIVAMLQAHS